MKRRLSSKLEPGDCLYLPTTSGNAVLCEVEGLSEQDVIVSSGPGLPLRHIPRLQVDMHGCKRTPSREPIITYGLEDPDLRIIYIRFTWNKTWVDKLYNWYCKTLGRLRQREVKLESHPRLTKKGNPKIASL